VSAHDLARLAREVDARCRLQGSFTLRSGLISDEYFDKYLFESDPALLWRVAEVMARLLPADTTLLGGHELGGVPLVTVLSYAECLTYSRVCAGLAPVAVLHED
jgi:orotate phosphoribosyltransferase